MQAVANYSTATPADHGREGLQYGTQKGTKHGGKVHWAFEDAVSVCKNILNKKKFE